MLKIYSDAGIAVLNSYLYVCGGRDKIPLNIVERYCPETNKWKIVSSMHNCRYSLSVVAFEGFIYALGGHDGNVVLDTVSKTKLQIIFLIELILKCEWSCLF